MLKKPSDEFHRLKSHGLPCFLLTIFILKCNDIVFKALDAVIGNSDTEYISGEIAQGVLPLARILTIHYPFLLPDVGIYFLKNLSLFRSIPEFGFEDHG